MSQPEMRSDRLRAELAEVKRQRDLLRVALRIIAAISVEELAFDADHCRTNSGEKRVVDEALQLARAALKATEDKP
jgi:hypothetical protein